jgi:hypothetical protein
MASFREGRTTITGATSEITVLFPATAVVGDLMVIHVVKSQTDRPVTPSGWHRLGDADHGIGTRRVSLGCFTIATAAMIATGSVDIVCTTSTNDSTMYAACLAFDISDWDGIRWATAGDFVHATSGTTVISNELATIFASGISIVFHAVGVTSRTAEGTTTEGGAVYDTGDTATVSARVWYNVAEVGELTESATVGAAGTINASQAGFASFGPSPDATTVDPCPDFDGIRVGF